MNRPFSMNRPMLWSSAKHLQLSLVESHYTASNCKVPHPVDAEGNSESLGSDLRGVDLRQEKAGNRPSSNCKSHHVSACRCAETHKKSLRFGQFLRIRGKKNQPRQEFTLHGSHKSHTSTIELRMGQHRVCVLLQQRGLTEVWR